MTVFSPFVSFVGRMKCINIDIQLTNDARRVRLVCLGVKSNDMKGHIVTAEEQHFQFNANDESHIYSNDVTGTASEASHDFSKMRKN